VYLLHRIATPGACVAVARAARAALTLETTSYRKPCMRSQRLPNGRNGRSRNPLSRSFSGHPKELPRQGYLLLKYDFAYGSAGSGRSHIQYVKACSGIPQTSQYVRGSPLKEIPILSGVTTGGDYFLGPSDQQPTYKLGRGAQAEGLRLRVGTGTAIDPIGH